MGNLTLFTTAFMVAFSGAMMPGPLLTVAINQSLRRGIVVGPLISMGHGLMEILLSALLVGLGQLLEHGLVAAAVALGGGLVLAWMGYGMIREGWQGEISLDLEQGKEQRDGKGAFAAGVVATVANPYWLLWWATIGANFVALARECPGLGFFFSGHIWPISGIPGGLFSLYRQHPTDKLYCLIVVWAFSWSAYRTLSFPSASAAWGFWGSLKTSSGYENPPRRVGFHTFL